MIKSIQTIALLLLLSSCSNSPQAENVTEESPKDVLAVSSPRIAVHNELFESMKNISKRLDSINVVRKLIYVKTKEDVPNVTVDINSHILFLNSLLKRNENEIAELNKKLNNSKKINVGLSDSITELNEELIEKQKDIMDLYEIISEQESEYRAVEASLYMLYAQNAVQALSIRKQAKGANTVYYAIGNQKELTKMGILDKNSGLLGLRPGSLSSELSALPFTKSDLREKKEFQVDKRHAKLLTIHSTRSYKFEKEGKNIKKIIVTDPVEFWRVSKFLVIKTD